MFVLSPARYNQYQVYNLFLVLRCSHVVTKIKILKPSRIMSLKNKISQKLLKLNS